jgi:hypothetical protein
MEVNICTTMHIHFVCKWQCVCVCVVNFIWESKFIQCQKCWYMKAAVVHCRNAWESHAHMQEELSDSTLAYWTAASWLQAFRSGRVSTTDMHHGRISTADIHHGRCVHSHRNVNGHNWTLYGWRWAEHTEISMCTVLQITWQDFNMHKTTIKWVPHHFNVV